MFFLSFPLKIVIITGMRIIFVMKELLFNKRYLFGKLVPADTGIGMSFSISTFYIIEKHRINSSRSHPDPLHTNAWASEGLPDNRNLGPDYPPPDQYPHRYRYPLRSGFATSHSLFVKPVEAVVSLGGHDYF